MPRIAVALGSNLGDRRAHLEWAIYRLSQLFEDLQSSSFHETDPVDTPDPQPKYLNAAVVGTSSLAATQILDHLLSLEAERGRRRYGYHAARTLDLDLILYGEEVIDTPRLTVPHPGFRDRRFVLEPLAEIAGDWIDPVSNLTIRALLEGTEHVAR